MGDKRTRRLGTLVACAAFVWAMMLAERANGITIYVPQNYSTIEMAFDWAQDGDEIVVATGVYWENVSFEGRNVVLRSTNPTSTATIAATTIYGDRTGPVVTFAGTEASSCVLSGFTIRNGEADAGGGILGNRTLARIEHNIITNNSALEGGGGLHSCDGVIQNNTITNNLAPEGGGLNDCNGVIQDNVISVNSATDGGGFYACEGLIQNNTITNNFASQGGGLNDCDGVIQDNVITVNSANARGGGLYGCDGVIQNNVICVNSANDGGGLCLCQALIQNNTIMDNLAAQGGGLFGCSITIRNNTITGNDANWGGGLYACQGTIVNCILWGNSAPQGPQIFIQTCSVPTYSCIQGHVVGGTGNIRADPCFCGPDNCHLLCDSPCIDAGTNADCPTTDKDGNARPIDGDGDKQAVCDMGAYEYVPPPPTAVPMRFWALYR